MENLKVTKSGRKVKPNPKFDAKDWIFHSPEKELKKQKLTVLFEKNSFKNGV